MNCRSPELYGRTGKLAHGERDLRSGYALNYALLAVCKGVGSLGDDQLKECSERLWRAEQLAADAPQWIGTKLVRGICTLCGGLVQCMQFQFVPGIVNILRSWQWIKLIKTQALHFEGYARPAINCRTPTTKIRNQKLYR